MTIRQNTLFCSFDRRYPRLSAYDIHEWVGTTLNLHVQDVSILQIDGAQRQVYVKLREYQKILDILESTNGEGTVRHSTGEVSKVRIEAAGLGIKRVRLTNLPQETTNRAIQLALGKFGDVKESSRLDQRTLPCLKFPQ
jgi:hypothetical protein